jgi:hypothetical protein
MRYIYFFEAFFGVGEAFRARGEGDALRARGEGDCFDLLAFDLEGVAEEIGAGFAAQIDTKFMLFSILLQINDI